MSDNNQAPSMTLPEKVIQHVSATSAALEKAASLERATTEKQAQVESLIPKVCDVMIEHERIAPGEREKLAERLRDPVAVLELLTKVADHRNHDELARLGSGVNPTEKQASAGSDSYDSITDPNVGARTTRVKQSSLRLFSGLGLTPPAE